MASASSRSDGRRRGSIRERGGSLQVRVYAGPDPVTGRDRYLTRSVKGTDRAARKLAEKALTRLQAEVDKQRVPETAAPLAHAGRVADRRDRGDDPSDLHVTGVTGSVEPVTTHHVSGSELVGT